MRRADRVPGPRRGLRREEAAQYVGVGATKFDQLIEDGRMPQPIRIDGCVVWDIVDLDRSFEALKERNPFDDIDLKAEIPSARERRKSIR
jgi:predicted DNA-binding transcriptional regulator AlpA